MQHSEIDPTFKYKEYIGRARDFYVDQANGGGLTGDRLEATKSMAVALTVAYDQAPADPAD